MHFVSFATCRFFCVFFRIQQVYAYGPLLGMFAFGLFTRRQTNDRWVPLIAILSPLICYLADWWIGKETGYKFGYELLMLNGTLTFAGLICMSKKGKNDVTKK